MTPIETARGERVALMGDVEVEDKALFCRRLSEALAECGAHRYDSLLADPLVYESNGDDEYVYRRSAPWRRANVSLDSLPAMMAGISMAGLV